MTKGKFITLEGGEGAGKSTQVKNLASYLSSHGIDVVVTREVGGCPGAEAIRDLWLGADEGGWDKLTDLLLVAAARREHLVRTIWPALERGAWVVSDRYADSTRVYQGAGLGVDTSVIDRLYAEIAGTFQPDLTFILDLPVSLGLERMASRHGPDDRFQQQNVAFHEKLRQTYLAMAKADPNRFAIVDASPVVDVVSASLAAETTRRLGPFGA